MPRYFECPDSALEGPPVSGTAESYYYPCFNADGSNAWIELTEQPVTDPETVSLAQVLIEPQFTEEERFILLGSITLAFATAWAWNIAGKFLFPRN